MRTSKSKRIVSMIMAVCLVFGSAGLLPQSADNAAVITASANEPEPHFDPEPETKTEGDYDYSIAEDDTAVIANYRGDDATVTIPSTIGGKKVTVIGSGAFTMNTSIESVTVPEGVTTLENDAFSRCDNLATLTLPSTLTHIMDVAVADCPKLTSVTLPAGLKYIGGEAFMRTGLTSVTIPDSVTFIDFRAFIECEQLKTAVIGTGLSEIPESCFERCTALKKVTMSNNVTTIGMRAFNDCSALSDITLPSSLHEIADGAFSRCLSITGVTLPASLTMIGRDAFDNTGLTSITIPDTVTYIDEGAFRCCQQLTTATLGTGVTYVPADMFFCCDKLASITIPEGCMTVEDNAFASCYSLSSVTLPSTLVRIGKCAFMYAPLKEIKLPEKLQIVDDWAFAFCQDLESIEFHENLKDIGSEIFLGTRWLENQQHNFDFVLINDVLIWARTGSEYTIPSNVRAIAGLALAHNHELAKVTITENVEVIGDNAFEDCPKLKQLDIPKTVKTIGMAPASFCSEFESYNVDKDNPNYTSDGGILYNKDKTSLIACPAAKTSADIPDTVVFISGRAFANCSGITAVTLPKGLKGIDTAAFKGCTGLTAVDLPSGIEYIGESAFENCTGITSVTIPSELDAIEFSTFRDCTSLGEVFIPEGVERISDEAFANCPNLKAVLLPNSVHELGWGALGVMMSQDPEDEYSIITTTVDGFTIYGYDEYGVGKWYAQDYPGMTYVHIANNVRLAGANRYATSAAVSAAAFPQADSVIIASGSDFPDALAGTTLAAAYGGPILLTAKDKLPDDIREEITRLGAKQATILGGTGAVSENVENALREMGLSVDRAAGSNRYATAAEIAKTAYLYIRRQAPENLFFVIGDQFADALSVSPVAGATNSPILFVGRTGTIDKATLSFINTVKSGVKNVYVIGGTGAISEEMQAAIDTATGLKSERIAGVNRYETSTAILKKFAGAAIPGGASVLNNCTMAIATGTNYPDALSASAVCAVSRTPLMLVDGKNMTDAQKEALKAQKSEKDDRFDIAFVGGEGVIPEKYARSFCMQITLEQNQGGEATKFEDSNLYKFMQKLETESFETEIELDFMGGKTTSLIKKNNEAMYAKTTSPLDGEDEETYKVGGTTYVLNPTEHTYREETDETADFLSVLFSNSVSYEVISTTEENGLIVERIKITEKEGDNPKSSESIFRFNKETGDLVSTESENGGMKMSAIIKSFKTGPLEIKLPDLSDWTKEDDDDDDDDF